MTTQTLRSTVLGELRPFWTSILLLIAIATVAFGAGVYGASVFWLALAALVAGFRIVRGLNPTTLTIERDGFRWRAFGRPEFFCGWLEIDRFIVGRPLAWMPSKIGFNFRAGRVP